MKKRYGVLLAAFLLILAVCTYASNQIYRKSLPAVQTVETIGTRLNYLWELSGTLHYENKEEHSVPVPVSIAKWAVQTGDRVSSGEPLLQVDAQQLHIHWLQCKIDEEALEAQLKKSKSFAKELLELQLTELQKTIGFVENLIAADGWIMADADGIVLKLQSARQAAAGMPLVTIGPDSGEKTIQFLLTEEQTAYCEPGTKLEVKLLCGGKSTAIQLAVDRILYSAERKGFLCTVSTDMAVDMMEGQETFAVLAAESKFYHYVIPAEAIVANNNGNASFYVLRQRETIMGTEFYAVLRTGYILEQNESYAALNGAVMEPVIAFSDAALADGQPVLKKE